MAKECKVNEEKRNRNGTRRRLASERNYKARKKGFLTVTIIHCTKICFADYKNAQCM